MTPTVLVTSGSALSIPPQTIWSVFAPTQNLLSIFIWIGWGIFALLVIALMKGFFIVRRRTNFMFNSYSFYKKKYFFSFHEFEFYKLLSAFLIEQYHGKYDIFPKVKLLDLADTKYRINFNKIAQKHVDFLIVDKDQYCNPILAIELNGASHETEHYREVDEFKSEFFDIIDIPFLVILNTEVDTPDLVREKIKNYIK